MTGKDVEDSTPIVYVRTIFGFSLSFNALSEIVQPVTPHLHSTKQKLDYFVCIDSQTYIQSFAQEYKIDA